MSLSILICDDSRMARKQLKRSLPEGWDVTIHEACDGVECMDSLQEHDVRLTFLDLTMPSMDGYEVLRRVKHDGIDIPIIVISADIQPEARQRVEELGALTFMKKPIDSELLRGALVKHGFLDS